MNGMEPRYMHFTNLFVLNIFSRISKINSDASRSSAIRICTNRLHCNTGRNTVKLDQVLTNFTIPITKGLLV